MARDRYGNEFHPREYDPDSPRVRCIECGKMNSCNCKGVVKVPWYPRFPILMNGGMIESVTHITGHSITISEYTEWSLQKIVDTPLTLYPTQMLIIRDFIHPELYKKLKENWPDRQLLPENKDVVGRFQTSDYSFNEFYINLYTEVLNNSNVKYAILDKLGLEWEPSDETDIQIWEDTIDFKINDVHVDFKNFDVTFGLYMPDDDSISEYGTEFWSPNKYTDDLDETFQKDECDFIMKVPFIPNIVYFMPRTNKSWHSSPDINRDITRKHIYGFYKKK